MIPRISRSLIRAYRKLGDDLQKDVHEDMVASFSAYPNLWSRGAPDANIDHRRMIVHNIGAGPKLEDVLFDWKVIGHFRYKP